MKNKRMTMRRKRRRDTPTQHQLQLEEEEGAVEVLDTAVEQVVKAAVGVAAPLEDLGAQGVGGSGRDQVLLSVFTYFINSL